MSPLKQISAPTVCLASKNQMMARYFLAIESLLNSCSFQPRGDVQTLQEHIAVLTVVYKSSSHLSSSATFLLSLHLSLSATITMPVTVHLPSYSFLYLPIVLHHDRLLSPSLDDQCFPFWIAYRFLRIHT
jgi:hypothetical protein